MCQRAAASSREDRADPRKGPTSPTNPALLPCWTSTTNPQVQRVNAPPKTHHEKWPSAKSKAAQRLYRNLIACWLITTGMMAGHRTVAKLSWKSRASRHDLDRVVQSVPIIPLSLICLTCGWNLPYCAFSFLGEQRGADNEVAASPLPQSIYPHSCHYVVKAAVLAGENKRPTWETSGLS